MRIIFNLQGVGLVDNGGSATIVNSANTLSALGHKVTLVSEKENDFSWFDLDGPIYVKTKGFVHEYEGAAAIIATGAYSVQHILNAPVSKGAKFWWVRAHESWAMGEEQLFEYYKNPYLKLLTNSTGLQTYIENRVKRRAEIVRPGIDLDKFYCKKKDWQAKKRFVLGGLYCDKPRKRFQWVVEIYEACKARGLPVKLHLFGTYKEPKGVGHSKYVQKPGIERLRKFYNDIDIWLAPTKSEGLHMPPQEAMLCGCIVIGAKDPLSGMQDYLKNYHSGFTMEHWSNAVDTIENLFCGRNSSLLESVVETGRQMIVDLGDRKTNMIEMVRQLTKGESPLAIRSRLMAMRRRGK